MFIHSTYKYFSLQDYADRTWDDMGAGLGINIARPQGLPQMQAQSSTGPSDEPPNMVGQIIGDFFGYDPLGTSYSMIPDYSESQHVLQTPPDTQEIEPEVDVPQLGRGQRAHNSPKRYYPSDRKNKPDKKHRR